MLASHALFREMTKAWSRRAVECGLPSRCDLLAHLKSPVSSRKVASDSSLDRDLAVCICDSSRQQQQYQTPACLEGSTKREGTAKVSTFCIRMVAASTLSLFSFSISAFYSPVFGCALFFSTFILPRASFGFLMSFLPFDLCLYFRSRRCIFRVARSLSLSFS